MTRTSNMAKNGFLIFCAIMGITICSNAQTTKNLNSTDKSPKLVVGIVIDQMRWDYLYRFAPLFKPDGGFKRMMNEGFSCDNAQIGYTPTVTACGHTGIYTGSVPAIHGITGNNWWSRTDNKNVYCTEDKSVMGIGTTGSNVGQMSPKNMLTTTIGDELRLATQFKSKVIGIAIKDRGAILPAGHSANGAYWFDAKSGYFITSSYYSNQLPNWVNQFNNRKLPDSLLKLGWQKTLKDEVYLQYATADEKEYEGTPFGKNQPKMPYDLTRSTNEGFGKISSSPHGNTITVEMAKAAIIGEELGKDNITDLLAISFSSPDYIGHAFGPNSWEMIDDYIRLDEELGKLFAYLDKTVGKGKYTAFLSADHGVAHIAGFMKEFKLPGGTISEYKLQNELNADIKIKFGIDHAVVSLSNYQIHLNQAINDSAKMNQLEITKYIVQQLLKNDVILHAFPTAEILNTPIPQVLREKLANGYMYNRSGDIQMIFKPGYMDGGATGTTHGLWNPYDSHIPLLFYGWGIKKGSLNKEVYMHDIASTLAALLHIQMPSGNIGHPITEILK